MGSPRTGLGNLHGITQTEVGRNRNSCQKLIYYLVLFQPLF